MIWAYHHFRKPPYWRHLLQRKKYLICWEPYRVNSLGFCSWKLKRSTSSAFGSESMCSSRKHQKHWLKTIKNHLCLHSHSPKRSSFLRIAFEDSRGSSVAMLTKKCRGSSLRLIASPVRQTSMKRFFKKRTMKTHVLFLEVPVKRHYNCSANEGH